MPKHIARLIMLMAVFGAAALLAKSYFTADSFYRYGHYRAESVREIAAREPAFQTSRYCTPCHAERVAQWSANGHTTVICEVCHGPARGHPTDRRLPMPTDSRKLCTLCHEAMPGRPSTQLQVDVSTHYADQQCIACHDPHAPKAAPLSAQVAGDAVAGRKRAAACIGCHGAEGISVNDAWPNLAGQHAPYLARMLAAFKSGARKNEMMAPIAHQLRDSDMRDLAAHFAALECRSTPIDARTSDTTAGTALAKNCAACHGETGIAVNPAWPSLAGQKPGYIVATLKAFKAGLRTDPMMTGIAQGLSDADIANLAPYFAAQSCRKVTQARRGP
jgi:cytochrome c553